MSETLDIGISLKKIITGLINTLLKLDRKAHYKPEELVHEFRKGIKRIRSLFRLFKPVISDIDFHSINEEIAEIGRSLTFQRESFVNLQTFLEIKNNLQGLLSEKTIRHIDDFLYKQFKDAYSNANNNSFSNLIIKITFQLSKTRDKINNLTINEYNTELLELSIERSLYKTINYFNDCKISLHLEAIHKWRRFCKHIYTQLKFGPLPLDKFNNIYIKELDRLSEILGKEHDYAVLDDLFAKNIYRQIELKERILLIQHIEKERNNLRKEAFSAGKEFFAKKISFSHLELVNS